MAVGKKVLNMSNWIYYYNKWKNHNLYILYNVHAIKTTFLLKLPNKSLNQLDDTALITSNMILNTYTK